VKAHIATQADAGGEAVGAEDRQGFRQLWSEGTAGVAGVERITDGAEQLAPGKLVISTGSTESRLPRLATTTCPSGVLPWQPARSSAASVASSRLPEAVGQGSRRRPMAGSDRSGQPITKCSGG
jgi:hypothetical protein